jgi:uncharacterized protein (TIGR03790 family)
MLVRLAEGFFCILIVFMSATSVSADSLIRPQQVAVVVNDADPASVEVGRYYLQVRRIPDANLIHVNIPGSPRTISPEQFQIIRKQIESKLEPDIQVIVMVWTSPYAVGCNSITSAMTLGYDAGQCQNTCSTGTLSPYFDSPSMRPFSDLGIRPSMLLPVTSVETAKVLIDRGVLSGFRMIEASAYFLATSDPHRNTRAQFFPPSGEIPQRKLEIKTIRADQLENKKDVMFYQTGLANVPKLETLGFLPGALADHLTSAGGDLLGKGQMSSLKWLEAGATASYGTVSEPCNHWQKFPNPLVLLKHYLSGETAIEAYWKSVAWPAQGVFIGEPLAAPYCAGCALEK